VSATTQPFTNLCKCEDALSDATSKFRAALLDPEWKTSGVRALPAAWVASEPSLLLQNRRQRQYLPRRIICSALVVSSTSLKILSQHILRESIDTSSRRSIIYLPHESIVIMESESVGSSDEEVTFSWLRFPGVNIKPVVLRSYRYPVASRYQNMKKKG
jgi:hypothetical protein